MKNGSGQETSFTKNHKKDEMHMKKEAITKKMLNAVENEFNEISNISII